MSGTSRDYPHIGPEPLLLTRTEVDELYNTLGAVTESLDGLNIPYILIAGTLLGAVRSESILFNDDDVDIAIIDNAPQQQGGQEKKSGNYQRMLENLPELLRQKARQRSIDEVASAKRGNGTKIKTPAQYMFKRRPWPGCDRVKSSLASRVWVDLFVMRQYHSLEELLEVISTKENGQDQPQEYVDRILSAFKQQENGGIIAFPLYHFENRKAIELWPREYLLPTELRPIRRSFRFGPLTVAGPAKPVQALLRFFGDDCFTHYILLQHVRGKKVRGDTASWEKGEKVPLADEQYLVVQHSRKNRRVWTKHCRRQLENFIAKELSNIPEDDEVDSYRNYSLDGGNIATGVEMQSHSHSLREQSNWFGATVRAHTGNSPEEPTFDNALREVMEPHLVKARLKREQSQQKSLGSSSVESGNMASLSIASNTGVPYPTMRLERPFLYDAADTFPLHKILAAMVGIDDLALLHEHPIKDKRMLLFNLLDCDARREFHQCYDTFVTSFCIPLLHSIAISQDLFATSSPRDAASPSTITYRYQAFPCLRVVRPGEFSIGPHCDIAYGHSIGNINFHVPLTSAFGTNSLFTESFPGKEDWHSLRSKAVGLGYLFDGARCLHFALENTTDRTRVSIDFRIALTRCKNDAACVDEGADDALCSQRILEDRFSSEGPGYYEEAYVNIGQRAGPVVVKKRSMKPCEDTLADPDKRVGFPFR